jgi:hypothetical protein
LLYITNITNNCLVVVKEMLLDPNLIFIAERGAAYGVEDHSISYRKYGRPHPQGPGQYNRLHSVFRPKTQ